MLGLIIPGKHDMYMTACEFVEKTSDYVFLGCMNVTIPCTTIPYLLLSYFMYLFTDMKRDAFILPFIMWYLTFWFSDYEFNLI